MKKLYGLYALGFVLAASISGCSGQNNEQSLVTTAPEISQTVESSDSGTETNETVDDTNDVIESQEPALTESPLPEDAGILSSIEDIDLHDTDGSGKNFVFHYDGKKYKAQYTKDHWKIINSYQIKETSDMTIICQGLIDLHPVHGKDMKSFRTAEDMAFEWLQHNLVYEQLPDDSPWKKNVKDVDLDPADQGKTFKELYEDRTGKKFRLKDFIQ